MSSNGLEEFDLSFLKLENNKSNVLYSPISIKYALSMLRDATSGNSKNVLYAAVTAHAKGMKVIGLTGAKSCKLEQLSDVCIKVPQTETYMIQELHLPVYHCLCLMLEEKFFGENS